MKEIVWIIFQNLGNIILQCAHIREYIYIYIYIERERERCSQHNELEKPFTHARIVNRSVPTTSHSS